MSSGGWGNPGHRGGVTYAHFPGDWVDDAACVGSEPDLFFPDGGTSPAAVATCRRCPVVDDCLSYALNSAVDGIWGGTTTKQRIRLRRQLGITVPVDRIVHGTPAGARAHQRRNETPCTACRQAELARQRYRQGTQ